MDWPRIQNIIDELNQLSTQRKELHDQLWTLENEAEALRLDLLKELNEKEQTPN